MLRELLVALFVVNGVWASIAQCNGFESLCAKHYDEVAYLTTHNAYNAGNEGFAFPNQTYGITQQLDDGVCGLMLDVYDQNGTPVVYHGSSILGSQPLASNLSEIKSFLDANPTEIITIILECYVDASTIETALDNAGLLSSVYAKTPGQDWATLEEMVTSDTRLVIFSDVDDAGAGQEWYHYVWDYAVETHYSVNSSNSFTNDYNRGDAANDLFIFNHFVTNATLGIGVESEAQVVNDFDFLMNRIEGHYAEYAKFPNFITVDFYHHGAGHEVVDSLNSETYASQFELQTDVIVVQPNPVVDVVSVSGLQLTQHYTVEVISMRGRVKRNFEVDQQESAEFHIGNLSSGMYILRITSESGVVYNHRMMVE